MLKIEDDMTQIFVTKLDSYNLRRQLEDMFCKIDTQTQGEAYSMTTIERRYPMVAELFDMI